jgi:hypothetical protein
MNRYLALIFILGVSLIQAQTPLGTVTGLATDPSGSAIANATIELTNKGTGVKLTTKSNGSGAYSLPNLAPGTYSLSAEAPGFKKIEVEDFPLLAFRTARQDLKFAVAGVASDVTVEASSSTVIQVDTPSISSTLLHKQIVELPTNLRSVMKNSGDSGLISGIMAITVPGVQQVGSGASWISPGAQAVGLKVKVDGIETTFGNFGYVDNVSQPSVESVQEFTANIMTNRAEFGGVSSVTSVTKSGTNAIHADVFYYVRNSALDARNAFQTARSFTNLHNYGATAGGPIKKDKAFFTFTFDGARGVDPYTVNASVPTAAEQAGDFTGFTALKNPFTNVNPFNGNQILPQFQSPQTLKLQQIFYPLPNFGPANLTANNFRAFYTGPETHRGIEARIDQDFSARHRVFLRYQNRNDNYQIPGARGALPPSSLGTSTNIRGVNFWTLGDTFTVSPTVFNEFRAGVVILSANSDNPLKGQAILDQAGIGGLPSRGLQNGLPVINIAGLSGVSESLLNPVNDGHAQLADNITWVRGRHTMKFGAEWTKWFVNRYLAVQSGLFGTYTFTGQFTGNPYADFLLGLPSTVLRLDPYSAQYDRYWTTAFYAQDDFKITRRLTLSYGLRYEYYGPVTANGDNFYSFDLSNGKIVVPTANSMKLFSPYFPATIPVETASAEGLGRSLRNGDTNNFAPRFGFSYQLDSSAKTVLRGGYGIYYDPLSANVNASLSTGPFAVNTTATNSIVNGQPLFTMANPFAAPGSSGTLNVNAISPRLLNAYVQQYSLTIERELSRDIGIRVSFNGSKATNLIYKRNVNQPLPSTTPFKQSARPYPVFNNVVYADNGADMLYNALQVQVTKRFTKSLMFTSSWTWAKELSTIDDTGYADLNTQIQNAYDRNADLGNVFAVPRHQWQNNFLYELPFGKNKFLGGWQLNGLFNMQSGDWLTPVYSGADPSNTNNLAGRPDVVGIPNNPHTVNQWFDTSAFAIPPAGVGRFGNAGRGIIQGPGWILANLGLQKSVRTEKIGTFQLVVSFQNVLNHLNLGDPVSSTDAGGNPSGNVIVANGNAGKITQVSLFPVAGNPRTGMMGFRWMF